MHRSRVIEDQISLSQSHLPMWYAKGLRVDSNIHLIPNVPRNSEEPPHQHLQLIICQWCVSLQSDENDFVYQVISSPFQVASCNCLTNSEAPWLCSLTESPTPKCRVMLHCVGSRPYMRRTHIGLDVLFDSTRVSGLFRVSVPWKKHLQHYSTIPSPAKPKGMWKSVLSLWRPLEPQVVKADCIAIVFRHRKNSNKSVGIMALSATQMSLGILRIDEKFMEIQSHQLRFWVPHHMTKIIRSIFILWSFRVRDCCLGWLVL